MGGVLNFLTGANTSPSSVASNVGNYYSQAGQTSNQGYAGAEQQLQNAYAAAVPQIQQQFSNALPGVQAQYANAAPTISSAYSNAEGNLINATGSPAAATFAALQAAGLAPGFQQAQSALPGEAAALGLTGSGAAANLESQLGQSQASALASADAPLYANAESQYGNLLGQGAAALGNNAEAGAGAAANLIGAGASATANEIGAGTSAYGNMLGAQEAAASSIAGAGASAQGSAYTGTNSQNIADFYNSLDAAASALTGTPVGGNNATPTFTDPTPQDYTTQPNAQTLGQYPITTNSSIAPLNAQPQLPQSDALNPYEEDSASTQGSANYNPYAQAS